MTDTDLIASLKQRIKENGLNWTDVCDTAGMPHSTYWRWMQEPPKSIKLYAELSNAVDYLAANKK